jgi:hypothetical protein
MAGVEDEGVTDDEIDAILDQDFPILRDRARAVLQAFGPRAYNGMALAMHRATDQYVVAMIDLHTEKPAVKA